MALWVFFCENLFVFVNYYDSAYPTHHMKRGCLFCFFFLFLYNLFTVPYIFFVCLYSPHTLLLLFCWYCSKKNSFIIFSSLTRASQQQQPSFSFSFNGNREMMMIMTKMWRLSNLTKRKSNSALWNDALCMWSLGELKFSVYFHLSCETHILSQNEIYHGHIRNFPFSTAAFLSPLLLPFHCLTTCCFTSMSG